MAKRIVARKSGRGQKTPRKGKLYTVQGHELTDTQHEEFCLQLTGIRRQFPDWDAWQHEKRALDECLYRWRPSVIALKKFNGPEGNCLYQRTQQALLAIGRLKHLPIGVCGVGPIRIGNVLIKHIADELSAVASELRSVHDGIAKEVQP
jgi:hypothetical protein